MHGVFTLTAFVLAAVLLALASLSPPGLALPTGFTASNVLNMGAPAIRMRFLPDGRLAYLERERGLFFVASLAVLPLRPQLLFALQNVESDGELGALSFAVDPAFTVNGYIYVYYCSSTDEAFRISRFTLSAANIRTSEVVLWRDPDTLALSSDPYHFGGDLAFGPDGKMYLSQGEKSPYNNNDIDKTTTAMGCVHRINTDGTIPANNDPFKSGVPSCFANGIRNGFRATWDFPTNRYFVGSVGGNDQTNAVESIYRIQQGKNYGWPNCEGPCTNPDFASTCTCTKHSSPIFWYNHKDSADQTGANAAVILGFVYRGTQFPASTYNGALFYADWARGFIKYLTFDSSGRVVGSASQYTSNNVPTFTTNVPGIVCLEQGSDGSLFYSTMTSIFRVTYSSSTLPTTVLPAAAATCAMRGCALVPLDTCKCDVDCVAYNDCCLDYQAACGPNNKGGVTTVQPGPATSSPPYLGPRIITVIWATTVGNVRINAFVGDTVRWFWNDTAPHTVTGGTSGTAIDPDGPASGLRFPPASYAWVVPAARTFSFFCQVHPAMTGVVIALPRPVGQESTTTAADTTTEPASATSEEASVTATVTITVTAPVTPTGSPILSTAAATISPTLSSTSPATTTTSASTARLNATTMRCALKGCKYSLADACQCDPLCSVYGDCCVDYVPRCNTTQALTPPTPLKTCAVAGCGLYMHGSVCQCDARCGTFGNCCSDFSAACINVTVPPPRLCAAKGCYFIKGDACQCDSVCAVYGDCCGDYTALCNSTAPPLTTTRATTTRATTTRRTTTIAPTTIRRASTTSNRQTTRTTSTRHKATTARKSTTTTKKKKKTTCAQQGCVFRKGAPCQCDKVCFHYRDCCADYLPYCLPNVPKSPKH